MHLRVWLVSWIDGGLVHHRYFSVERRAKEWYLRNPHRPEEPILIIVESSKQLAALLNRGYHE